MYVENLKELYGISNKNMEIYIDWYLNKFRKILLFKFLKYYKWYILYFHNIYERFSFQKYNLINPNFWTVYVLIN